MTKELVKFENPFKDVPADERKRTTIDIPMKLESDLQRVKSGTILQTTINILLKKLRDEFERNGLTYYAPDEYELAVVNCSIILGGKHAVITSVEATPTSADTGEHYGIQRKSVKRRATRVKRDSAKQTPKSDESGGTSTMA